MKYGAITIDPETMSCTPVFTGTRVPVTFLFDYLQGSSVEEFLENYLTVSREQVFAVLETTKLLLQREEYLHENFA